MASSLAPTWGIYDTSGNPIFNPSNLSLVSTTTRLITAEMSYRKEARVCDFPVEKGSFASYNKVEVPSDPVVVLCLAGSDTDRANFLVKIEAITIQTGLYSIVTPEITYINHTIERYNYSRRANKGSSMLTVELYLKQVREITAQTTKSDKVNAANTVNSGPVNGATTSGATEQKAKNFTAAAK